MEHTLSVIAGYITKLVDAGTSYTTPGDVDKQVSTYFSAEDRQDPILDEMAHALGNVIGNTGQWKSKGGDADVGNSFIGACVAYVMAAGCRPIYITINGSYSSSPPQIVTGSGGAVAINWTPNNAFEDVLHMAISAMAENPETNTYKVINDFLSDSLVIYVEDDEKIKEINELMI